MTIIELLEKVGIENVLLQRLDASLTNISTNKKGVSKITFETNQMSANDVFGLTDGKRPAKTGFVLWLPTDKLPKT